MPTSWNTVILTAILIALVGSAFDVEQTKAAETEPTAVVSFDRRPLDSTPEPPANADTTPVSYSAPEQDAIDWAVSRFEMIGLELPEAEINFYPTAESCHHSDGLYEQIDGRHVLSICVRDGNSHHQTMFRRRTIAHELAHAWEHENLDEQDREELMALLDTEVWYSADVAWKDRGGERLAETIVWGLFDQRNRPVLIDQPCHELHRDFIAITGQNALGPIENYCSPDTVS